MNALDFYVQVAKALDEMDAPYMIIGAFAGLSFGITRATFDVDMIVDLKSEHADALSARFPLPRYYADPDMIRNSMEQGVMFNLIDTQDGVKADLVPLKFEPEYRIAFARRARRTLRDRAGNPFEAWVALPSDIIIGKLHAWAEGRSPKHSTDIYQMVVFDMNGLSDAKINMNLVTAQAARLGSETFAMWQDLVERAKKEAEKNKAW